VHKTGVRFPARSLRRDNGSEISLTRSEFELLHTFLRHAGWVLSRDQLRSAVAGRNVEAYERSVDMLVGLRRKLDTDANGSSLITTVSGVGYRFAVKPQALTKTALGTWLERAEPAEGVTPEAAQVLGGGQKAVSRRGRKAVRQRCSVRLYRFPTSFPSRSCRFRTCPAIPSRSILLTVSPRVGLPAVEYLEKRRTDEAGTYVFPGKGEDNAFGSLPTIGSDYSRTLFSLT
jgi:DNA-binding winged helix-turn-helix (wHTH) protein